jgi:hypothetical protein
MAKNTYKGSCHCGAIRYEADIDFTAGTGKCNCSICWKKRSWTAHLKPADFRLLAGKDALSTYQFGTMVGHHGFCKHCGIATHSWGNIPAAGGEFVSVQVSTLDDVDPALLAETQIRYQDGRNNNWWNQPAETRHL